MFCGIFIEASASAVVNNLELVSEYLIHHIENDRPMLEAEAHLCKALRLPLQLVYRDMDLIDIVALTEPRPTRWQLVLSCNLPYVQDVQ